MILAIDPGTTQTAYVDLDSNLKLHGHDIIDNQKMLEYLRETNLDHSHIAIEMIACYGMGVGKEVFETCLWIGRFIEAADRNGVKYTLVYRQQVKQCLCHSAKANDSNIRAALIDRYGPGKDKAIGKKKSPGPLYGVKADVWSALAVGVTYLELTKPRAASAH